MLCRAVSDTPPLLLRDGGVIRDGFNEEIDKLRMAMKSGKDWLRDIEAKERQKTGIPKLKISYNRNYPNFGYNKVILTISVNIAKYKK